MRVCLADGPPYDTEPGKDTPAPARWSVAPLAVIWSRSSTSVDAVGWAGGGARQWCTTGLPFLSSSPTPLQPAAALCSHVLQQRCHSSTTARIAFAIPLPVRSPQSPLPHGFSSDCRAAPHPKTRVHTSLLSGASPAPDSDCEAWRERQAWHDPDDRPQASGPVAARCR